MYVLSTVLFTEMWCLVLLFLVASSILHTDGQKMKFVSRLDIPLDKDIRGVDILPVRTDRVSSSILIGYKNGGLIVWHDGNLQEIYSPTDNLLDYELDPSCVFHGGTCSIFAYIQTGDIEYDGDSIRSVSSNVTREIRQLLLEYDDDGFILSDMGTIIQIEVDPYLMNRGGVISIDRESKYIYFDNGSELLRIAFPGTYYGDSPVPRENPHGSIIYAMGFNNLQSCYHDKILNKLLCIDRGTTLGDSVFMIFPKGHYGSPSYEGNVCLKNDGNCYNPKYYEIPMAFHNGPGKIVSGRVYRGASLQRDHMNKFMILADNMIYHTKTNLIRNKIARFSPVSTYNWSPSTLDMKFSFSDASGNFYVIANNSTLTGIFLFYS